MLLAGEMLMMLIMLNPFPDFPKSPQFDLTLLTLLTFPPPEAFFWEYGFNIINIINIPLWGAKNASGRGNVNNVKPISGFSQESPFWINIINIPLSEAFFTAGN